MARTEEENLSTHMNAQYLVRSDDGTYLEIRYVYQIERNQSRRTEGLRSSTEETRSGPPEVL